VKLECVAKTFDLELSLDVVGGAYAVVTSGAASLLVL